LFFCLETKEPKIQGSNFLGYKLPSSAKPFELASLKQRMLLNAPSDNLLNATKFKALTSLGCLNHYFSAIAPLSFGEGLGVRYKPQ